MFFYFVAQSLVIAGYYFFCDIIFLCLRFVEWGCNVIFEAQLIYGVF
jgi:hypothetical protein